MTPENKKELDEHLQAIAKILYEESDPKKVENLAGIEETIREQTLQYITPQIGFFIKTTTGTDAGRFRKIKSIIGELPITEKQATKLNVKKYQRISPLLEQCCIRASANVSYENAARDIEYYTGMKISAKTQQRIIHRYDFPTREFSEKISEVSVDGGKVRLRTEEKGQPCIWKDYKAVCIDKLARKAWFCENEELVNWVNQQPLSDPLNCLGDGHPGIWKLVKQFNSPGEKREILDWFHLVENLHKVGGSLKRLEKAESLLWEGKIDETIDLISILKKKQATNFCNYLESHRHRIINYSYYKLNKICSIASGAVESTVKQIDRRLKISGAQWNSENVPQVRGS
ncbi:MAG: ISKra4 family transposase [Moorea sp. SIO3C2]|nr:ISKra4 family transposase [Moorena sp. SIO3C2]